MRTRPQEHVGVDAAPPQDLRQRCVVAERVDVAADRRGDTEPIGEVALRKRLPDQKDSPEGML